MIRAASPGPIAFVGTAPAGISSTTSRRTGIPDRSPTDILRSEGVSVHRRAVLRRDRPPGDNILADHPAEGIEDADLLQPQRGDCIQYLVQGLINADHTAPTAILILRENSVLTRFQGFASFPTSCQSINENATSRSRYWLE